LLIEGIEELKELFSLDTAVIGAIRILVILLAAVVLIFILSKLLRKLEEHLATMGISGGDQPSEARKRARTLFGLVGICV
jgi:flagellar biosynthesis protein FlhB